MNSLVKRKQNSDVLRAYGECQSPLVVMLSGGRVALNKLLSDAFVEWKVEG